MRIVTWNCRRATEKHLLWDYLTELNPDVALLQEVSVIPVPLYSTYDIKLAVPRTRAGGNQRFTSALLVKGAIGEVIPLCSRHTWVREQLAYFAGNILAYKVTLYNGFVMNVVATCQVS